MHLLTRFQSGGTRRDQLGMAMLELVLALPFTWLILALTFNFGQALVERQRTLVALREVAIRHGADVAASGGSAAVSTASDAVSKDTLIPRRMSATFFVNRRTDGTCPQTSGGNSVDADENQARSALGPIGRFLATISSAQVYEVTAQGPAIVSSLVKKPVYDACLALDVNPWTYQETGGLGDMAKSLAGGLGRFISGLF